MRHTEDEGQSVAGPITGGTEGNYAGHGGRETLEIAEAYTVGYIEIEFTTLIYIYTRAHFAD